MTNDTIDKETKMHVPINFSPFANNVLDYTLRDDLKTPGGQSVKIVSSMSGFHVFIDQEKVFESKDNVAVSYFLNTHEVGLES